MRCLGRTPWQDSCSQEPAELGLGTLAVRGVRSGVEFAIARGRIDPPM